MAGNSLSFGVGGSPIKSIQRGIITIAVGTATATITAVDTTKSVLSYLGTKLTAGSDTATLVLTDSTTITATMTGTGQVSWQLVEHY